VASLLVAGTAAVMTLIVLELHSNGHAAVAPHQRTKADGKHRRAHAKPALASLAGPPLSRRSLRPHVAARGAIVVDDRSGRVLWALHAHRRLPIASTTKIMTAVVALPLLRANTLVRVAPSVTRVPLVREGLRPHERVRAWKLFRGLLMYSGNDDALALAIATAGGRKAFIALMNERARQLGLRDSHFSTPSGVIDADNYSSAWDLAALTRVALRNERFRRIVRTRIAHIPWSAPTYAKVYVNKNPLLGTYRGANGVKTGWTTLAGHCLVASATRGRRTIVVVVLHDALADRDARRLLDLGFATRA
jgi:serine-type D-Ala-D-Ala carboxypeptidase (penicillin-binding protein 5/6)